MSLQIKCDDCGSYISDGDDIFCESCYNKLEKHATDSEDQVEDAENTISDLKEEIEYLRKLVQKCDRCSGTYTCDHL